MSFRHAQLKTVFFLFQDVATHCDVKCMPTFQFYKNGKKVGFFLWSLFSWKGQARPHSLLSFNLCGSQLALGHF